MLSFFQVKEAMQRIHDRGNIGKLILDVEKAPTPLVSEKPYIHSAQSHWLKHGGDLWRNSPYDIFVTLFSSQSTAPKYNQES